MTQYNGQEINLLGRQRLYTYLTQDEVLGANCAAKLIEDLEQNILPVHCVNAAEEEYLLNYYAGDHPQIEQRVKETRGDINNKLKFNFAKSFTRDIVSYFLGKPIQYVQRSQEHREAAEKLSNAFDAESKNLVDYNIATDMSICGVGYRGVFTEKNPKNGTHLSIVALDPRQTFVVFSPEPGVGALYCGTYYSTPPNPTTKESKTYYTVYTKTHKYVFVTPGQFGQISTTGLSLESCSPIYLGGTLPIVEYDNTQMMIGDWESELSLMDAIDKIGSDSVNDIEQFVNSILLAQGFEMDAATLTSLEQNKMLNIPDVPPGVEVVVKYIAEQVDSSSVENLRDYLESTLRSIVGVPDRKTKGGGADTGDAVFLRDGWQDIDLVAGSKEQFFIDADRNALATALEIMKTFNEIDDNVRVEDFEIKFSRTKQANMQAKAQAYATLVGAEIPVDQADALEFADLTNNVSDVVERSQAYIEEERERAKEEFKLNQQSQQQSQQQISNQDAKNETQSSRS